MNARVVAYAGGIAATATATLLAMAEPIAGLGTIVLALIVLMAVYRPLTVACVLAFLTAAFPKAGIKVGDFPFPIFLFGLLFALILIRVGQPRHRLRIGSIAALGLYLTFVVVKTLIFLPSGIGVVAAFVAWAAVPVVMLFISVGNHGDIPRFRRSIQWGFVVAAAFGLIQFVGGIERTAIPGLTIAYGDSYAAKNNVIFAADGADFSKIPSTYQNGNIFGVVSVIFLILALMRLTARNASKLDALVLAAAVVAIFLSGSRTAILIGILGAILVIFRRGRTSRKIAASLVVVVGAGVAVKLQPGLAERYSLDNLVSSGGAGRTEIWSQALSQLSPAEFIFGTSTYISHEGWVGIVEQMGLFGIALLIIAVLAISWHRRDLGIMLVLLGVAAILDSSYQLFPTWFIPAALAATPVLGVSRVDIGAASTPDLPRRRSLVPGLASLRLSLGPEKASATESRHPSPRKNSLRT